MTQLLVLGLLALSPVTSEQLNSSSQDFISSEVEETIEEPVTTEEEKGLKDKVQDLTNKINTLISNNKNLGEKEIIWGFTLGSLVSFAITAVGVMYNIHWKKKLKTSMEEKILEAQEKITESYSSYNSFNELATSKLEKISVVAQESVSVANETINKASEIVGALEKYASFNENQELIITILGELSNTPEYVKSGAKTKIKDLLAKR